VPTRPPALKKCRGGDEAAVNRAYQVFTEKGVRAEILTGYEGNEFAFTGDVKRDILSITSVHPMKKEAVEGVLAKAGAGWPAVEELLKDGSLLRVNYKGEDFFLRKI
jgi:wyosine [tRNA(Phe)-imidazoG37] synthetase (radical SAM superfamily)